jgi:hypothetical protein
MTHWCRIQVLGLSIWTVLCILPFLVGSQSERLIFLSFGCAAAFEHSFPSLPPHPVTKATGIISKMASSLESKGYTYVLTALVVVRIFLSDPANE